MMPCVKKFLRARPGDYMMALSVAGASLPFVGKRLEPLGAIAAMSVFGARIAPEFISEMSKRRSTPDDGELRRQERDSTNEVSATALRGIVSPDDLAGAWPAPERRAPVLDAMRHRKNLYRSGVHYGDSPAQLLDVWRKKELPATPAPVLLYIPGGAWIVGSRAIQGYAMLSHLAEQGWVCLSIDYRVAPHHRWPRHIQDVKAAIAWARANVDKFGGDRDFIAVAGASAGGHLAALAGLTGNDPQYEAELPEGSDTSVDAVVGIYGRYDWEDRSTPERIRFVEFLERIIVKRSFKRHPEIYRDASPIARVHKDAPPFLVIHGSRDNVIPVWQARSFVERLRSVSHSLVGYVELPGAGHGFDMLDNVRTGPMSHAVALFLNQVHRTRAQFAKEVI